MNEVQLLVLGCCIMDRIAYLNLLKIGLSAQMFIEPYRELFNDVANLRSIYNSDMLSVSVIKQQNSKMALKAIESINEPGQSTALYEQYFQELKKEYISRRYKQIVKHPVETEEQIHKVIGSLANIARMTGTGFQSIDEIVDDVVKEIDKRQDKEYTNPFKTGFIRYDKLGRFEQGSLALLGGDSGHGKTSFVLNLVNKWIQKDQKVLFYSLEMTKTTLLAKLNSIKLDMPFSRVFKLKGDDLVKEEIEEYKQGLLEYKDKPLVVCTELGSPEQLQIAITEHQPNIVIIDTINQLLEDSDRFWLNLSRWADKSKRIMSTTSSPEHPMITILITQLKERPGRPISKSLIAESKRLIKSADYIDNLYREAEKNMSSCSEELKNTLEVYRVKGRLTGIGMALLGFNSGTSRVRNLSETEYYAASNKLRKKKC